MKTIIKPILRLLSLLAFLLLSGCAVSGGLTNDIKSISSGDALTLDKKYTWTDSVGLFNVKHTYSLVSGVYRAEKESSAGYFYRGPKFAVSLVAMGGRVELWDGGIFVPKDVGDSPKVYIYRKSSALMSEKDCENNAINKDWRGDGLAPTAIDKIQSLNSISAVQAGVAGGLSSLVVGVLSDMEDEIGFTSTIRDEGILRKIRHGNTKKID